MRKMAVRALLLFFVVVPGGFVALALYLATRALASVQAADPKWSPALAVLVWSRIWCTFYRVPYPLSLAVLHNEGASTVHTFRSAEEDALTQYDNSGTAPPDTGYPVGDVGIANGPSFGPGQVERVNILRVWAAAPSWLLPLVSAPDAAHLAYVGYERAALWCHVQILLECLTAANGDLHDAARRYNGSGTAAQTYADNAINFLSQLPT